MIFGAMTYSREITYEDLDDLRDMLMISSRWMKCNWFTIPEEVYALYLEKPKLLKTALHNAEKNYGYNINEPVMVQAPCFSKQSTGNHLADYIEARICANVTGMHYIATTVTEEHVAELAEDSFISSLPKVILHRFSNSIPIATELLHKQCTCAKYCHASNSSLIYRYSHQAARIFKHVLRAYAIASGIDINERTNFQSRLRRNANKTIVRKFEHINVKFIPEVAIHMRCSDSKAGFLPFRAYLKMIPSNAKSIYILTEDPDRFDISTHSIQIQRCNAIIHGLFHFIANRYPHTDIVLFQGKNPYDDLLHLVHANIAICSVSSFCFWAAIANTNKVYFPINRVQSDFISTKRSQICYMIIKATDASIPLEPNKCDTPLQTQLQDEVFLYIQIIGVLGLLALQMLVLWGQSSGNVV
eukprot:gene6975-14181_t